MGYSAIATLINFGIFKDHCNLRGNSRYTTICRYLQEVGRGIVDLVYLHSICTYRLRGGGEQLVCTRGLIFFIYSVSL